MSWLKALLSLRRGQAALANGEAETALECFNATEAQRPKWGIARLWLASALSEVGNLEEAREALERRPRASIYRSWLGRILIDHRQYSEACDVLEEALEESAANVFVPGYLALARWADADDDTVLDDLLWELPSGGDEFLGRWLLEIESRFPGGPGTDFYSPLEPSRNILQKISRWRSDRLVKWAETAIEKEDYLKALSLLERAESMSLGGERVQELRFFAHQGSSETRLKQLETDIHDVDLRLDVVEDLLEIGRPTQALDVLEPALDHIESIDPHRLSWRAGEALLRGRALLGVEAPEEAATALLTSQELWPTEVEPLYYLAVAKLRSGLTNEARRAFVWACSVDSDLARIRLAEYREAVS